MNVSVFQKCIWNRNVLRNINAYSCSFLYRHRTPIHAQQIAALSTKHELNNDSNAEIFDIIVSGGGLVGSAMACSLGLSPYLENKKILLLEGGPPLRHEEATPERFSNRVTAISPGSQRLLKGVGAWELVSRSCPVKRMQVWDSLSPSAISFQNSDMQDDIVHIVENGVLLRALAERLSQIDVEVKHKVKVTKYTLPQNSEDLVTLELQDGTTLTTKLLIGADGFNSLVRKSMGVQYISWNYDQHAIVATLKLAEPMENNVAFQRFLPTGPVALLPLTNELSSLVWTVRPDMAKKLMDLPDDRFTDELNAALWEGQKMHPLVENITKSIRWCIDTWAPQSGSPIQLPPGILEVEPLSRASFPLGLGHASNYVGQRVALIGDSAHRVHPLAGLGLNLGFGDVQCLTGALEESLKNGNNIGYHRYLSQYETERQRRNVPVMAAIDGLKRLYGTSFIPLVALRSMGLQIVDSITPLKNTILHMASR